MQVPQWWWRLLTNEELTPEDEFYFQWHITERCNKRCLHCYQDAHFTKELSLGNLHKVLAIMESTLSKWDRVGSISFTGGEPFIRQTDLFALLGEVDQIPKFSFYDILTNGSLITDDIVTLLKQAQKLRRIQISLEGSTPGVNDHIRGQGSFAEIISAIRKLKQNNFTVSEVGCQ